MPSSPISPRSTQPAYTLFPITPNDGADLPFNVRGLHVNTAGTLAFRTLAGVDVTITVAAGVLYPYGAVRVLATGTTATVHGVV